MMAGLEWTEPVAVRQWQWQTQGLPEAKNLLWLFAKWALILGLPVLFFVYRAAPTELPRIATIFLVMAILHPMGLVAQVWISRKDCVRYSVEGKGLRRRASHGAVFYHWKTIESYRIVKHSHVTGVSVLELKIRRFHKVRQWSFNPCQVEEQEILRAMQKHLPERSQQSPDTRTGHPAI